MFNRSSLSLVVCCLDSFITTYRYYLNYNLCEDRKIGFQTSHLQKLPVYGVEVNVLLYFFYYQWRILIFNFFKLYYYKKNNINNKFIGKVLVISKYCSNKLPPVRNFALLKIRYKNLQFLYGVCVYTKRKFIFYCVFLFLSVSFVDNFARKLNIVFNFDIFSVEIFYVVYKLNFGRQFYDKLSITIMYKVKIYLYSRHRPNNLNRSSIALNSAMVLLT